MKTILSTLTIAMFCLIGTSQATDVLTQQLKGDATFLRSGQNGDDDCYSFKLGEITFEGEKARQISRSDLMEVLGITPVIVSKEGCATAGPINPVSLILIYADGVTTEYPSDLMQNINDQPGLSERLLHNAVSVTFTDIGFSDEAGVDHKLADKVFEIK